MADDDEIIIRRRPQSATITLKAADYTEDERAFLRDMSIAIVDNTPLHWLDRWRLRRLIERGYTGD